ncbi:3-ketoacyl-CoA synthase 6 [Actinidia rufa]|uniref:3-ketoacyl-CoA synthase 6 n=1 Tax=Actinidia rufa TaxID=165716 RepID=A0A7J0GYL4_9ERIC|nr:3-ketoacyl-CoA synthase 6 [Actinidia rufa]
MPQNLPNFSHSVRLKYVKLGYQYLVNHIITFLLIPIMAGIVIEVLRLGPEEILGIPRSIYLVDYACYKPPVTCRVPFATFMEHSRMNLKDSPKSVDFQMRILERSGLGEETCLPPAIHYIPPNPTMEAARGEAELVIFSAIDALMKKTGVKPKDIDILIREL